jgi:hypothetical protein
MIDEAGRGQVLYGSHIPLRMVLEGPSWNRWSFATGSPEVQTTNLNQDGRDADRWWIGILADECRLSGWQF